MSSTRNKSCQNKKNKIKTVQESTLDDSNASKNTNITAVTMGHTIIDLDDEEKKLSKKYNFDTDIVFESIIDIKYINNHFFFLMKYFVKDLEYKKWFKNIDDLVPNHKYQLLLRFADDLENLKAMQNLKKISEERIYLLKKFLKEKNMSLPKFNKELSIIVDQFILEDTVQYSINNGCINMPNEFKYLGKRNGKDVLKLIEDKKDIFTIKRYGYDYEYDTSENLIEYLRPQINITNNRSSLNGFRKIQGRIDEQQFRDCTQELDEIEDFIAIYLYEKLTNLKKRLFKVENNERRYIYNELDMFATDFIVDLQKKAYQLKG